MTERDKECKRIEIIEVASCYSARGEGKATNPRGCEQTRVRLETREGEAITLEVEGSRALPFDYDGRQSMSWDFHEGWSGGGMKRTSQRD